MSNPLRRKARKAQRRGLRSKAGDLDKFDSDRGWHLVSGQAGDVSMSFQELVEDGYRKNPVASSCLRAITNAVTDAPLQAFQENEDGKLEQLPEDHPAHDPILTPNPRDTHIDLIERGIQHYFLGGNVYWIKRRGGSSTSPPVDIVPRRPDKISKVFADQDDIPIGYQFSEPHTSETENFLTEDVIHIRDIDPWENVLGKPRILSASLELRTDNEASDYVSEVLSNHGQPGMVVGVKEATNRRQLERAEEMWTEKFGPERGRGKVGFVPGATRITQIGFNLKELEFPDLRMITRESICAVFGVDPMIVAVGSAAQEGSLSGGEHEEARRKMWMQTIIPMLRRWQAALNQFLAPEFGDNIVYKFDLSDVEALKESRNDQVKRASTMASTGAFTLEEIRREVNGIEAEPAEDAIIVTDMQTIHQEASAVTGPGMTAPAITGEEGESSREVVTDHGGSLEAGT